MNYIEILLRLNKIKRILIPIFLVFMISGHLLQKFNSKNYLFSFDIYFPSGSFLIFAGKQEIYKNFKNTILTELVKNDYDITKSQTLNNAYNIDIHLACYVSCLGENSEVLIKKKKEITDLFQLQKKNLIRWITNNYNITNMTLKDLPEVGNLDTGTKIRLELLWIDLEKEFVYENITKSNNIKFSKELARINNINFYAVMIALFIVFLTLYISYLIISEDFKKKIKKIKIKN